MARAGPRRGGPAVLLLLGAPLLAGCLAAPPPGPGLAPGALPAELEAIAAAARAFDGSVALGLAAEQTRAECTPSGFCVPRFRVTGSAGNNETALLIADWMAAAGFRVALDNFTATFEGRAVPAHNVVAERAGRTERVLYLGAHYDTRPCADKEPSRASWSIPVLGANDGASGVAVLVALARLLAPRDLNLTLRFLFFDAEDMGEGPGCGRGTPWAQGSARLAAGLREEEASRALGVVVLDMVGDKALELRREANSARAPHRALQDDLWLWAARLGHAQFRDEAGIAVLDDHVPFQERGLRAVDVIHLDGEGRDAFPETHHTTRDDVAHLGAASLDAVGETVLAALLEWDAEAGAGGARVQ